MKALTNFFRLYLQKNPMIKHRLKEAGMRIKPEDFIKKSFQMAMMLTITLTVMLFFYLSMSKKSLLVLLPGFVVFTLVSWFFMVNRPSVYIKRRKKEIEREVLFAGRFILVKIESGQPFFNALEDAARAHGVAGKYFQEIVDNIALGTPMEDALDTAIEYTPSDKFRRILWQITNSLKTGIDVASTLRATLHQITEEQIIEIKEYGRKLNAMAMFYMLLGVVVPALGITMFIIVGSFLELQISKPYLIVALVVLAFLQFMFMSMFRTIRPIAEI